MDLVGNTEGVDRVIGLACHEKHVFHEQCLLTWLDTDKSHCPLCRTPLHGHLAHQKRDQLNAEDLREMTGLATAASKASIDERWHQRWSPSMVSFAIKQYFSIPTNHHGAFYRLPPSHLDAATLIFSYLATSPPRASKGPVITWNHNYSRCYEYYVYALRQLSTPRSISFSIGDLKKMCDEVHNEKSSSFGKRLQEGRELEVANSSFHTEDSPERINESLLQRRDRFYADVVEQQEDRTDRRVVSIIHDPFAPKHDIFKRADLDQLLQSGTWEEIDDQALLTIEEKRELADVWEQLCSIRSANHKQEPSDAWDVWLRDNLSVMSALHRPDGYFAPMASLKKLSTSILYGGSLEPIEVLSLQYARTHTTTGQTRSGRQFRVNIFPVDDEDSDDACDPDDADGSRDFDNSDDSDDTDDADDSPDFDDSDDSDDSDDTCYKSPRDKPNDDGEVEDLLLRDLEITQEEVDDVTDPSRLQERVWRVAHATFTEYNSIVTGNYAGHGRLTFPVPITLAGQVVNLTDYAEMVARGELERFENAETYWAFIPKHRWAANAYDEMLTGINELWPQRVAVMDATIEGDIVRVPEQDDEEANVRNVAMPGE